MLRLFFFFNDTATTEIYTLSLHDALPIFENCAPLNVEPSVQTSYIASTRQSRGWDEVLLSVDGIVASGGNTLNQQAIWKAQDRKSTRLNSSHANISYAVFCLKKKKQD